MKILLVNDDGYRAEGINVLDRVLSKAGHEVWVCAPDSQRSACSHAINIHRPLKIEKVSERHYCCEGFPADCVLFADKGALPMGKPDIVISGINEGYNVGSDLIYSATAGGAAEGVMRGYVSFAVSCNRDADGVYPYEEAALFTLEHLEDFIGVCAPGCFVNINVPPLANGKWGVAELGNMEYYDNLVEHEVSGQFAIRGVAAPELADSNREGTDFWHVYDRSTIAVSVIKVLPSVHEQMQEKLRGLLERTA